MGPTGSTSGCRRRTARLITNDPRVLQSYRGLEITLTKRFTDRWQMLAGYTRSRNQIENVSVDVSPNFLINMDGNISPDATVGGSSRCSGCGASNADKPNQFKLTGMYILPWQELIISGNYSGVSGPPVTRQISRALAIGGSQTINLEPLGSRRLDMLTNGSTCASASCSSSPTVAHRSKRRSTSTT